MGICVLTVKLLQSEFITIKSSLLQYSCTHCHKRYAQQQDVQTHIERMHNNSRTSSEREVEAGQNKEPSSSSTSPRKCPQCTYTTNRLSMLQRHLRTHTGERPHKCDVPAPHSHNELISSFTDVRTPANGRTSALCARRRTPDGVI